MGKDMLTTMPVLLGGYDPMKIIESLLNKLIEKGILTKEEAQEIVDSARPSEK